ncbi:spermatogenesis-associated protein 24-like [Huso huso]|uniref:Spermatogenesis-associated protein 24-like n=1 Tax=Huso huso TaxID=61971 RepID=A0ABR0YTS5_HUSHU
MLGGEVQANNLVYNQLQDLIQTQQRVLATIRETMITKERELIPKEQYEEVVNDLENERLQHAKTQALLNQESEKLQFALGEIDILTNQMQREKKSFEKVLASIKNKALKESTKNDKLKSKCNGKFSSKHCWLSVFLQFEVLNETQSFLHTVEVSLA